jgi:ubiquinone/menaquinone biosynthesis C-methylase UbiE
VLVAALWSYSAVVLYPARILKGAGLDLGGEVLGDPPEAVPSPGLGPRFSRAEGTPPGGSGSSAHDELVTGFDRFAELYPLLVLPFSRPIFHEALSVIHEHLSPDARVLDAGCGPGTEALQVASLVPDGEVVGVDLAAGMVRAAARAARAGGHENCAFLQSDVGDLPAEFAGSFDIAYSCLAYHHFPDPVAAARSVLRCLRPGGAYFVIDPGPARYSRLMAPLGRWADPGWVGFEEPAGFRRLFAAAGFARTAWMPLLPGFGMATAQKAAESAAAPA